MVKRIKKKEAGTWIFLAVLFVLYSLTAIALFKIPLGTAAKFCIMNAVSIFLPGAALVSFSGIRLSRTGAFCMSYIMGYACLIAEYFFSEIFDRQISFRTVTIIVSIVSIAYLIRKITKRNERPVICVKESQTEKIAMIFLLLYVVLNIFSFSSNFLGPDVIPVFRTGRDMQYWSNNTVALKLSWPASNLFMEGNRLNYHYFSGVALAFLSEVYNIDVFTLSFPIYGYTKAVVLAGAVQFLVDTVTEKKIVNLLGYVFLILSTGAETISMIMYVSHILLAPFGFDIGYAYAIVFLGLLLRQWYMEQFDIRLFICTVLIWAMCVGAKAPVAMIMLFYTALNCLYWLIHKKFKLAFGYGITILLMFLLICKYCVGMFSVLKGDSSWSLKLFNADHFTYLGNAENWDALGMFLVMAGRKNAILGIVIRTICMNPVLILGTLVVLMSLIFRIREGKIKGKDIYLQVSLILTAITGIVLCHIVNAGGDSEMYFAIAAFIPMTVIILMYLDDHFSEDKKVSFEGLAPIKKAILIFFVLLLQLGIFRYSWVGWWDDGAMGKMTTGLWNLYRAYTGYDYSERIEKGIRKTDVDALRWIRDNTEKDAVIISDKAILTENDSYYLYGLFCERQQYLEGIDMLDFSGTAKLNLEGDSVAEEIDHRKKIILDIYNNKEGAIKKAKAEGAGYIIQTQGISDGFEASDDVKLVNSTETMRIYMIK